MALEVDPEVAVAMAPLAEAAVGTTPPPPGDWRTRRATVDELISQFTGSWTTPADVDVTDFAASAADGTPIPLRLYRKAGSAPGSLVVYLHAGACSCAASTPVGEVMRGVFDFTDAVDTHDPICRSYTAASGVPMLSVDFRFAPEHPFPASVEDCYAAVQWAAANAADLGVAPEQIAIMGDSVGGGMAAAVALMARDRGGPVLRSQILVYPMLDDRTTVPDPAIEPFAMWTTDDNITGWGCLLGDAAGSEQVSSYAAPARELDVSNLPPAYIEVG